jgi:hypothetical protein
MIRYGWLRMVTDGYWSSGIGIRTAGTHRNHLLTTNDDDAMHNDK